MTSQREAAIDPLPAAVAPRYVRKRSCALELSEIGRRDAASRAPPRKLA